MFEGDDAPPFRSPPPQDDRLWRHPSELTWQSSVGRKPRAWPLAAVSALTGGVLAVGILAATGTLSDDRTVIVHEPVSSVPAAMTGVTASEIARIGESVGPAVVRIETAGGAQSRASAVVFRDDGYALTAAHAIAGATELTAVLAGGKRVRSTVVGTDAATDLALLKLDGERPFRTAILGTTDGVAPGAAVLAIGAPAKPLGDSTVTSGVISALGGQVTGPKGIVLHDMIQTDAPIAAESTGGALVDDAGTVVGIAMTHRGWRCATPIDVARSVAEELLAVGHVRVVWFGIRGNSAADGTGVVVAALMEGAPASAAGLRDGDVIRRVDGRPVTSMTALRMVLRRRHPGDLVTVVYERDGKRRSAAVSLTERPA